MKRGIKNTLRAMARHLGFRVKFVDYFGDEIHGKLIPREKIILLNARKPRIEHYYTILHEIGHFVVHVQKACAIKSPRYLEIHWSIDRIALFFSKIRRHFRYAFNKEAGKEWQADLWAICAFIYLAKYLGHRGELLAFLNRHPEKVNLFLLASGATAYTGTKTQLMNFSRRLLQPFKLG